MTTSRALITRLVLPLAATALVVTACGSSTSGGEAAPAAATTAAEAMQSEASDAMESDMPSAEAMTEEPPASASGAYITLAEYEGARDMYAKGDVVLFFAADWCPTCQEATKNLEADPAAIPAGLAIVRVDYDNSDELRQRYGVTVQHTFVQIDADGNELAKWSGSLTAQQIAEQTT